MNTTLTKKLIGLPVELTERVFICLTDGSPISILRIQ
jgi:hypothetical protein